jgi:hypothetical protein
VVIPFSEGDLCKLVYTVKSLSLHDPDRVLGAIYLVWVSTVPKSKYAEAITAIRDSLKVMHEVHVLDYSHQVVDPAKPGWLVAEAVKLKIATMVSSNYYVVLEAQNTLLRDLTTDLFFSECRAKVPGTFHHSNISEPQLGWYKLAAGLLNVSAPASGYWPSSTTPVILHRLTVLALLQYIGEKPSMDPICSGALCSMLGIKTGSELAEDQVATNDLALYNVFARSLEHFPCIHDVTEPVPDHPEPAQRWAVSLGGSLTGQESVALGDAVATGAEKPWMFGMHANVMKTLSTDQQEEVRTQLVNVFETARLYDSGMTSRDDLVKCIVGKESLASKSTVGKKADHEHPTSTTTSIAGEDADSEYLTYTTTTNGEKVDYNIRRRRSTTNGEKVDHEHPKKEVDHEHPKKEERLPHSASNDTTTFCCMSARDKNDVCGTCWDSAVAKATDYCGKSEAHCAHCKKTWCKLAHNHASRALGSGVEALG